MAKESRLTSRYWEFLVYPDSVFPNWLIMWQNNVSLPLAVSPVHDPTQNLKVDVDLENKLHHHCIIRYPNSTTQSNIQQLVDQMYVSNKAPKVIKCYSIVDRYRYLVHLDDPDKQQFKEFFDEDKVAINKISNYCGFDIERYKEFDSVETQKLMDELEQIIKDKGFFSLKALCEYLDVRHRFDLKKILRSHQYYFSTYMWDKTDLADVLAVNDKLAIELSQEGEVL